MPDFSPLTIRHIQLSSYRIWFLLIFLFIQFFCVYNVCCVIRTIDCVSKTHFQSLRTEKIDEEKRKQQKNQPTGYLNSQTLSFSLTVFMRWISFLFIFFFHFIKSTKMMECRCWVSISLTIDVVVMYVEIIKESDIDWSAKEKKKCKTLFTSWQPKTWMWCVKAENERLPQNFNWISYGVDEVFETSTYLFYLFC